jgi:hypothetical protein
MFSTSQMYHVYGNRDSTTSQIDDVYHVYYIGCIMCMVIVLPPRVRAKSPDISIMSSQSHPDPSYVSTLSPVVALSRGAT